MARISGVNLPDNKKVDVALTYIYGVGFSRARQILAHAKIGETKRIKDLTDKDIKLIQEFIEKSFKIEEELRRDIHANIKRLKDIGSYRGMRHMKKLPTRGQRTKTNARTLRGKRKTVGSGRRKVELK